MSTVNRSAPDRGLWSKGQAGQPPSRQVKLMGIRLDALTEQQVIDRVLGSLDAGRGGWIITANLEILRRTTQDAAFGRMVQEADLVSADGMPLVWASRLQGTPLPQRVAGSTLVTTLAEAAAGRSRSLFLLGGAPGAAEGAACALRTQFPSLTIAGTHCPPVGFESKEVERNRLQNIIIKSCPDIVYVALGSPKQERLIQQFRGVLPRAWWLGVGISLSFLSGQVLRAPPWVQQIGLEWLHRLVQEPRRLARRYLVAGLPFALRLLIESCRNRGADRRR